ncbi:MAG: 1-aminocyclopropane-1-carboxylate deaminase/D-cysteine desulfhydrase, partial [Bacteroidia bacterium]|nr:1-aminocyclopropane-1-carboxylate deaminase/D-cysteine desulfhydrase [Bacteroidia bacterium]
IEPVYTGRLFFGLQDLLEKGFFDEAARIVVIHSGGMQYLTH